MKVRIFTLVAPPGNDLIFWVSLHGWQWTCLGFHVNGHTVHRHTLIQPHPFHCQYSNIHINLSILPSSKELICPQRINLIELSPSFNFWKILTVNLRLDIDVMRERERGESTVLCCKTAPQLSNVNCSFVIAWTQLGHASLKLLDSSQSSEKLPHFTWLFANK